MDNPIKAMTSKYGMAPTYFPGLDAGYIIGKEKNKLMIPRIIHRAIRRISLDTDSPFQRVDGRRRRRPAGAGRRTLARFRTSRIIVAGKENRFDSFSR
jgi:hypothetical protein